MRFAFGESHFFLAKMFIQNKLKPSQNADFMIG